MHDEGAQSSPKIFANIFISFVGAGVLGLPFAYKEAGVMEGFIIMTLIGLVSTKAMLLLIDCKYKLLAKRPNGSSTHDVETVEAASPQIPDRDIEYGDIGYYAIGSFGRYLVEVSIIVSQVGFSCAYLIFITENINNVLPNLSKGAILIGLLLPLFFLSLLRHLQSLGTFSLFADFANIFAYGIVYYFDLSQTHHIKLHPRAWSLEGFPFFLGIAIYCYEGAGMILSLEQSVAKEKRGKFRTLFKIAMFIVTSIYISFGTFGYLSFGPETNSIITLNLPSGPFPLIVKLCLSFSLFFTYPVMMFPVVRIIELKMFGDPQSSGHAGIVIRACLVILTGLVITAIPNFANLMALVGSSCCTLLSFTLPGFFHMKVFKDDKRRLARAFDWLLILLGIVGALIGTQDALSRIFSGSGAEVVIDGNGPTAPALSSTHKQQL
ncbi:uncharacterized protein [Oscarella lobularis]|uniref:uncharacterized protein n=1 Tax=Oscarella lobularis TaxID=121494 RepID=UPI003313F40D